MLRQIDVIVSPNGEITVQTEGYSGAEYLQATRVLEERLGVVATACRTAEYFETAAVPQPVGETERSASAGGAESGQARLCQGAGVARL